MFLEAFNDPTATRRGTRTKPLDVRLAIRELTRRGRREPANARASDSIIAALNFVPSIHLPKFRRIGEFP